MKLVAVMAGLAALGVAATVTTTASAADPAGDPVKGRTVFARCAACHDLNTGATRLGPSLKGVIGRKSASLTNFSYSPALKGKNVTWNRTTLDAFLTSPTAYVPGTRMAFAGISNPQDRANLIAYLQQSAR